MSEERIRRCFSRIWRNFPSGAATFSSCQNHPDNGARDGFCIECETERLAEECGNPVLAKDYEEAVRNIRRLESEMIEGD